MGCNYDALATIKQFVGDRKDLGFWVNKNPEYWDYYCYKIKYKYYYFNVPKQNNDSHHNVKLYISRIPNAPMTDTPVVFESELELITFLYSELKSQK